jgi:hypothetical protein
MGPASEVERDDMAVLYYLRNPVAAVGESDNVKAVDCEDLQVSAFVLLY